MALPMYLLRRSAASVSPALYYPDKEKILVRIIESQAHNHSSSHQAAFVQVGKDNLMNEQPLTYAQLLKLVLKSEKVVTL